MAPLDWNLVMTYPLDNVNDDLAEQLFDQLQDYSLDDAIDVPKMRRLFEVTRSVMQVKALQADVAVDELEQMAKQEGISRARRERELLSQIDNLKQQLARRDSGSSSGADVQKLIEDVAELQQKNEKILENLRDKEKYIEKLKQTNETQLHMISESEKYSSSLRTELEQLREELALLHQQQEKNDLDVDLSKEKRYQEQVAKLKTKNQQIHHLMDENRELEEDNIRLKGEVSELKTKLEESVEHIERITNDFVNLNEALLQSRNRITELENIERTLRSELDEVQEQNRLRLDLDDEIMDLVTQRVEEWKTTYTSKEVNELRDRVKELEMQLAAIRDTESEQLLVNKLNKRMQERDREVQILKSQLEQATKDMENNLNLIEQLKLKLSGAGLPMRAESDSAQDHIFKLETLLQEKSSALTAANEMLSRLEEEARLKDKELSEAVARMRQYETGVYGLSEAVSEIKDCRNQIRIRDKHVEDLIQQVNQAELLIGELLEENEDFRERLGMELKVPDVGESSKLKYETRWQKEKSLNVKLQADLERLEDENIALKQELHKVRKSGVGKRHESGSKVSSSSFSEMSEVFQKKYEIRIRELEKDLSDANELVSKLKEESVQFRAERDDLDVENKELHMGMKEILDSIKEQDEKSDVTICSPALDRLLQFIETKQVYGSYDARLTLKSEVDQLKGHNEELRCEVKRLRQELIFSQKEVSQLKMSTLDYSMRAEADQEKQLEKDDGSNKVTSKQVKLAIESPIAIAPEEINEADIIQPRMVPEETLMKLRNLEEEKDALKKELEVCKEEVECYKREYSAVNRHIQPAYHEFFKEKEKFEKDVSQLNEQRRQLEESRELERVKANEFETLIISLESSEEEQKKNLGELARKVALLKVNENALKRRYLALQENESSLRRENARLRRDFCELESSVIEQLGYFQRENETLRFKLKCLHQEQEDTVSSSEFEKVNRLYLELNAKHRALLERHNALQEQQYAHGKIEHDLKEIKLENAKLKGDLEVITTTFNNFKEHVASESSHSTDSHDAEVRKIPLLEMQVLNESQKTKLAVLKVEQQNETMKLLENRNKILESNLEELTKMNTELMQENIGLREQISRCVSTDAHALVVRRVKELEGGEISLRQELSNLKDMLEIARGQANMLELTKEVQNKELDILRQQVLELQGASDSNASKGQLLHQILTYQLNESSLSEQLEKSKNEVLKLQAQVLRLRQDYDKQEETFLESKKNYDFKIKSLNQIISDLQQKYASSITVRKQEELYETISQLRNENVRLCEQLESVTEKFCDAQSQVMKHEAKIQTLNSELARYASAEMVVDDSARSANKTLDKLEISHRRNELQAITRVEIRDEELKHQKELIKRLENRLDKVEKENAVLETELLEKEMKLLKHLQGETGSSASASSEAVMDRPNIEYAVDDAVPLDEAKESAPEAPVNVGNVVELTILKRKLSIVEKQLKESENSILERDKIITELRTRVLTSVDEDRLVQLGAMQSGQSLQETLVGEMSKQALNVAHATIECLQIRLAQKEESIACYRELLDQARIDYSDQLKQTERELQALQEQLRSRDANSLAAIKKKVSEILSKPHFAVELREREDRINELEEALSQQEQIVASLTQKLDGTMFEYEELKQKLEEVGKESEEKVKRLEEALDNKVEELKTSKEEYDFLRKELEASKELLENQQTSSLPSASQPAPDTFLRSTVDKLKTQLSEKEKQLQALSRALTDLRAEMVAISAGQENARGSVEEQDESYVQKLVDQRTSQFQAKLAELESTNRKAKRDLRSAKDENEFLNSSIKYLQEEVDRKSSTIDRLMAERNDMQKKVESMRATVQRHPQTSVEQEAESSAVKEVEQLRHQIIQLEEQLQRQQPAEKPYDQSREQVVRWEESKKWQRTTEQLRAKLKEKQKEIEMLQKNGNRLKEQVMRSDKEKSVLENKVKNLSQLIAVSGSTVKDAERLELQKNNIQLEKEIHALKHGLNLGNEDMMQEMTIRNKILLDKIEELEKELVKLQYEKDARKAPFNYLPNEGATELKQKIEELELEVLRLTDENFSLRLQLQQERTNNPQLQHQISLLEKELKILKSEDADKSFDDNLCDDVDQDSKSPFSSVLHSNIDNLNSDELKLMILTLRSGVRKLQSENVTLKKGKEQTVTGVGGTSVLHHHCTLSPKSDPRETRAKLSSSASSPTWKDVAEQRISKVLAENTRLGKELRTTLHTVDNLRAQIEILTYDKKKMAEKIDFLTKELDSCKKSVNLHNLPKYI